jgi:hypothetical protein
MSKYIIELDDRIKLVTSVGVTENGVVYATSDYAHNLEELNSDYINEHYGELQDEAYQRGLEDAWEAARKIIRMPDGDILDLFPDCYASVCTAVQAILKYGASEAIAKLKAYEENKDEPIKMGDIVERYIDGKFDSRCIYLQEDYGYWRCLFYTGVIFTTFAYPKGQFKKTGKHYDIASILEAMRK